MPRVAIEGYAHFCNFNPHRARCMHFARFPKLISKGGCELEQVSQDATPPKILEPALITKAIDSSDMDLPVRPSSGGVEGKLIHCL